MSTVKAAPHNVPPFYACYLLRSLKPGKKNRTYVGSTPDPARVCTSVTIARAPLLTGI